MDSFARPPVPSENTEEYTPVTPIPVRAKTHAKIAGCMEELSQLPTHPKGLRSSMMKAPWDYLVGLGTGILPAGDYITMLHWTSFAFEYTKVSAPRIETTHDIATNAVRPWERRLEPHFPALNITDWTDLFSACARMRIIPDQMVIEAWHKHGAKAMARDQIQVEQLSSLMQAFGRLSIDPGQDFVTRAHNFILHSHPRSLFHDYNIIICACSWLDAHHSRPEYRDIVVRCRIHCFQEHKANQVSYDQVRDASLWFDIQPYLPPRQRPDDPFVSKVELDVGDIFQRAGINIIPEKNAAYFPLLDKSADHVVLTPCGSHVYVEVDGPRHFDIMPGGRERYNGPTVFQQALVRKLYPGTAFLRVPTFNFDTLTKYPYRDRLPEILHGAFGEAVTLSKAENGLSGILSIRKGKVAIRRLDA